MNARFALSGAIALLAALASPLGMCVGRAEVVFGNLGPNGTAAIDDNNNSLLTTSSFRAHGFVVSGTNRVVQSIVVGLESENPITARVQIFADSSGAPSGTALGTSSQEVTTTAATLYSFSFPNVFLNEGSTYWAVVSAQSSGFLSWSYNQAGLEPSAQNGSGYGFAGTITSSNSGSTWSGPLSGFNAYPSMSISAVPEPATWALGVMALGLGGIAAVRRRRLVGGRSS